MDYSKVMKLMIYHNGEIDSEGKEYVGGCGTLVEPNFSLEHLSHPNILSYLEDIDCSPHSMLFMKCKYSGKFCVILDDSDVIKMVSSQNFKDGETLEFYVKHEDYVNTKRGSTVCHDNLEIEHEQPVFNFSTNDLEHHVQKQPNREIWSDAVPIEFDYPAYGDFNPHELHQTFDELVYPVDCLSDDEDHELVEARNNVREYRKGLRGVPTNEIGGSENVDMQLNIEDDDHNTENDERQSEGKIDYVINESVPYDGDEIGGLDYASCDSDNSVYYNSSDYGSYFSDSDEEYQDVGLRRKNDRVRFDDKALVPVFCLDMIFASPQQFRDAVTKYGVIKGLDVRLVKNANYRLRAECKGDKECPWVLHASTIGTDGDLVVKTYKPEHHCRRLRTVKRCNASFLGNHYKTYIMIHPSIKVTDLQKLASIQLHLDVSYKVCYNAKAIVIKQLLGDVNKQYAKLFDYCNAIRISNPGSSCFVNAKKLDGAEVPTFLRFYLCFDAMKRGWKEGCRPILGLDGCFLKGVCKGQLLCAVGRDANNKMYPVAWAVVEIENTENWSWFLTRLKADLKLLEGKDITLISDMQKGLIAAVRSVLPLAYHRMCDRHIYAAWSKNFRGEEIKIAFWAIAKSSFKSQLTENVESLRKLGDGIFEALSEYPLHTWIRTFFQTECKCDVVDNNMSETFNGWILLARTKPIISMLDAIRQQQMKRITVKRKFMQSWKDSISPKAMEKVNKNDEKSNEWVIQTNGDDEFEVTYIYNHEKRHTVDLKNWTCTCRQWQLNGIPCCHALSCIHGTRKDVVRYVSHYYSKKNYMKTYSHSIKHVLGIDMLDDIGRGGCLPPPFVKKPGRPKVNRRRDPTEAKKKRSGKVTKIGQVMRCSLCRESTHNIKKCPQKKDHPEFISPHQRRMLKKARTVGGAAITSGSSVTPNQTAIPTTTQASNAGGSTQHIRPTSVPDPVTPSAAVTASRARFRTSNESHLQASITDALKFAQEMSTTNNERKKGSHLLTAAQINQITKKNKQGEGNNK